MKEKMKKVLSMLLTVTLTAGVAISGTVAYLTSEDSDVNVMTLGNVSIEQHEYQRVTNEDGTYKTKTIDDQTSYVLEYFEQAKPLLPIVGDPSLPVDNSGYAGWDSTTVRMTQVDSYGSMDVFAGKNAQDKFVTVENTGKTDAYVRTLVAVECGSTDGSLVGTSYHGNWEKNSIGIITIADNKYCLIEYTYKGASDGSRHVGGVLPAGETSYPNLSQVYLKSAATNEDMEAIDGNGNGTLDILVFSQAVQADGFSNAQTALDTAFGDITTTNHPWTDDVEIPTVVSTSKDVLEALQAGESVVANNSEYNVFEQANLDAQGATVYLNGSNTQETYHGYLGFLGDNVTVSNLNVTGSGFVELGEYGSDPTSATANKLVLKDMTSTLANTDKGFTIGITFMSYAKNTILNNCVMTGAKAMVDDALAFDIGLPNVKNYKTTINGGEYGRIYCWSHSVGEINGAEVGYIHVAPIHGSLTIADGTHVGTINVDYGTSSQYATAARLAKIVIEDGATVDEIIYNSTTYTQAEWTAYVESLN